MNYKETIDYLFHSAPLFQHVGGKAYKAGLSNTHILDEHFQNPHTKYETIHIAGTNGKGSCAHTISAILQHRGLRVGLYTSPHLVDFRERIRVNGVMIPEDYVVNFVEEERSFFEPLHPSFFELTTALAFKYFADEKVDIAVIEVGLGGRLDCTNIVTPCLSVITNISLDHTQFLGKTLAQIAREKAGIIKPHVPVVIGEANAETRSVFQEIATANRAFITFSEDDPEVLSSCISADGLRHYVTKNSGELKGQLVGECQIKNTNTILKAVLQIMSIFDLSNVDIEYGLRNVCSATGLQGRWQVIHNNPLVVCDTGHNVGGWRYIEHQLKSSVQKYDQVHVVFGVAEDKDIHQILSLFPKAVKCYWTKASVHRAMDEHEVSRIAASHGLKGKVFGCVREAYADALRSAGENDFIYVGGSSFVVADLLTYLKNDIV